MGLGDGVFEERTEQLPQGLTSIGDLEIADVDADADLDIVLIDWGTEDPLSGPGGPARLWLNDGAANFVSANDQLPPALIGMSWDMEALDVDNDWDLDLAISCKSCAGSSLFLNDGNGNFTDASDQLPAFSNNYDFESADFDGDGFLDLITINDGPGLTEHIFINDGTGTFIDRTSELWPASSPHPGSRDSGREAAPGLTRPPHHRCQTLPRPTHLRRQRPARGCPSGSGF